MFFSLRRKRPELALCIILAIMGNGHGQAVGQPSMFSQPGYSARIGNGALVDQIEDFRVVGPGYFIDPGHDYVQAIAAMSQNRLENLGLDGAPELQAVATGPIIVDDTGSFHVVNGVIVTGPGIGRDPAVVNLQAGVTVPPVIGDEDNEKQYLTDAVTRWVSAAYSDCGSTAGFFVGKAEGSEIALWKGYRVIVIVPSETFRDSNLEWDYFEVTAALDFSNSSQIGALSVGNIWLQVENYRRTNRGQLAGWLGTMGVLGAQPSPDWTYTPLDDTQTRVARETHIASVLMEKMRRENQLALTAPH